MTLDRNTLLAAHATADLLIAASCFVVAAALFVFAGRNRRARLGRVMTVFAVLFTCGGLMHVCEAGGWHTLGLVFKALTALCCAASAFLAVRCLPAARVMFARAALYDQQIGRRLERLRSDPRYDTQEDREWQETLSEIKSLARMAREVGTPEEV